MTRAEFDALKKDDIIYVRDYGAPNYARMASYQGLSDLDFEPGLCMYLEEDGSPVMQTYGDGHGGLVTKPVVCYFSPEESSLTRDGLREILRAQFQAKIDCARREMEDYQERLARVG